MRSVVSRRAPDAEDEVEAQRGSAAFAEQQPSCSFRVRCNKQFSASRTMCAALVFLGANRIYPSSVEHC